MRGHIKWTCPGASVKASHVLLYDSTGVQADKIRILCSILLAPKKEFLT